MSVQLLSVLKLYFRFIQNLQEALFHNRKALRMQNQPNTASTLQQKQQNHPKNGSGLQKDTFSKQTASENLFLVRLPSKSNTHRQRNDDLKTGNQEPAKDLLYLPKMSSIDKKSEWNNRQSLLLVPFKPESKKAVEMASHSGATPDLRGKNVIVQSITGNSNVNYNRNKQGLDYVSLLSLSLMAQANGKLLDSKHKDLQHTSKTPSSHTVNDSHTVLTEFVKTENPVFSDPKGKNLDSKHKDLNQALITPSGNIVKNSHTVLSKFEETENSDSSDDEDPVISLRRDIEHDHRYSLTGSYTKKKGKHLLTYF